MPSKIFWNPSRADIILIVLSNKKRIHNLYNVLHNWIHEALMMEIDTRTTVLAVLVLALFITGLVPVIGAEDSSADGASFSIKDGEGKSFNFNGPVKRVITFGFATTLTVVQASGPEKVVACDKYSQYDYYKDDRLRDLRADDLGSPFIKEGTAMEAMIVQLVSDGKFDKEEDAILATNSTSIKNYLYPLLEKDGFKNLLFWGTFDDYSGLVDCVSSIAKVAGGVDNYVSKKAEEVYADALSNVPSERTGFIYLWNSSSKGLGIGDDHALGSSMVIAAGGRNIASDVVPTSGHFAYNGINQVVQYLESNPGAVVFVADNYVNTKDGETAEQAKKRFIANELNGNTGYPVYIMEKNWNNYCLDSVLGLTTISDYMKSLSPKEGDGPDYDSIAPYVVATIIVLATIAVAASLLFKRSHGERKNE